MRVVVSDAQGAAAADAAAIASGIPSRALMQRAGAAAAAEIATRCAPDVSRGVVVATGSGNNGGDGWVVARALHAVGIRVRVVECAESRTDDARAERALAIADGVPHESGADALLTGGESIAVDALLGTGFTADKPLRDDMARSIAHLVTLHSRGATVVALDLPSGLDATTGDAQGELHASYTLTFGTLKAGLLRGRSRVGEIVVLDIGLGDFAAKAGTAKLVTANWFRATLPHINADAHKGTRKKIAIIGGARGMAGAALLAARAALRSGAGLVKCIVADQSVVALQKGEPAALSASWPQGADGWKAQLSGWADAVLIGPGLGRDESRAIVEQVLRVFDGPVVLDADALNAFTGDAQSLGTLVGARQALLTPHPLEFSRLAGMDSTLIPLERQLVIAQATHATVLLKGVPTVIITPSGDTTYVAEGTPILATGGSGDVLGGIAATLLAQLNDAETAGALAAFAHGRAASSLAVNQVRGYTIEDVIETLPRIWATEAPVARPPVLAELRAVWDSP
jgi:NAD(P)H-hydrate epimerase